MPTRTTRSTLAFAALTAGVAGAVLHAFSSSSLRARVKERLESSTRRTRDLVKKAGRDVAHRTVGIAHDMRSSWQSDTPSDEKLKARVRSKLGRIATHPQAIAVGVCDGVVSLSGVALRAEISGIEREVRAIRGVTEVENQLEPQDVSDPSNPGASLRPPRTRELRQEHWTPALRVGAAVLGTAAMISGLRQWSTLRGLALTTAGAMALGRAAIDKPVNRVLGLRATRRSLSIQKTVTVRAPIERVFASFTDPTTVEQIIDGVERIEQIGEHRWRWHVRGPLGTPLHWIVETQRWQPNESLEWRTVDESLLRHEGTLRFERGPDNAITRVELRATYNPWIGYLGNAVAAVLGKNPRRMCIEGLSRMKAHVEGNGASRTRERVTISSENAPPSA